MDREFADVTPENGERFQVNRKQIHGHFISSSGELTGSKNPTGTEFSTLSRTQIYALGTGDNE